MNKKIDGGFIPLDTIVSPETFIKMTPCDDCPCLNNDYEQGAWCNNGFDSDLYWMAGGKLINASKNCELIMIKNKNETFKKPDFVMARKARTDGKG